MKMIIVILGMLTISHFAMAQDLPPVISNVKCSLDTSKQSIHITYKLSDKEERFVRVSFNASADNGITYTLNTAAATGDVGDKVSGGKKEISWNYGSQVADVSQLKFRIVADDMVVTDPTVVLGQVDTIAMKRSLGEIVRVRMEKDKSMDSRMKGLQALMTDTWKDHYTVENQDFTWGAYNGRNVIARKRGTTHPDELLVLCASYDFNDGSPGANSNGTGVAGMMEISRLLSSYSFERTIVIIGFDYSGEEFIGSNQYVFHNGFGPHEQLKGVINLDRLGAFSMQPNSHIIQESAVMLFPDVYKKIMADSSRSDFLMIVSNPGSHELGEIFKQNADKYVPGLTIYEKQYPGYGELMVNGTEFVQFSDHIPFWYRKLPAVWITDGGAGKRTNGTPDDVPEKVNAAFWQNAVKASVATIYALGGPQHCTIYEGGLDRK